MDLGRNDFHFNSLLKDLPLMDLQIKVLHCSSLLKDLPVMDLGMSLALQFPFKGLTSHGLTNKCLALQFPFEGLVCDV